MFKSDLLTPLERNPITEWAARQASGSVRRKYLALAGNQTRLLGRPSRSIISALTEQFLLFVVKNKELRIFMIMLSWKRVAHRKIIKFCDIW
jgi:hypothetical protein